MDEIEDTLTPGTLVEGARMYAAAADVVNEKQPNSLHVLSHLLGTSIELALKAHLRQSGYTEGKLKKFGHDLGKLFNHAVKHGFEWTGSHSFVLQVAGHNYRNRLFVYPREGKLNVIMPWRLRQVADELIRHSFIAIKGEAEFEAHKNQPGLYIQSEYPHDLDMSGWAMPRPVTDE